MVRTDIHPSGRIGLPIGVAFLVGLACFGIEGGAATPDPMRRAVAPLVPLVHWSVPACGEPATRVALSEVPSAFA